MPRVSGQPWTNFAACKQAIYAWSGTGTLYVTGYNAAVSRLGVGPGVADNTYVIWSPCKTVSGTDFGNIKKLVTRSTVGTIYLQAVALTNSGDVYVTGRGEARLAFLVPSHTTGFGPFNNWTLIMSGVEDFELAGGETTANELACIIAKMQDGTFKTFGGSSANRFSSVGDASASYLIQQPFELVLKGERLLNIKKIFTSPNSTQLSGIGVLTMDGKLSVHL